MKTLISFLVAALLALPIGAQAKSNPTFVGGFSSGKSSSKSPPTNSKQGGKSPAPARADNAKSSFGSFGTAKNSKATSPPAPANTAAAPAPSQATKPTSALSQNLSKNAAQTNALKTLDARNAQKAPESGSIIGSNISAPGNAAANSAGQTPYAPPSYSAPAAAPAPPVVYQNNSSSGWTSGIIGFMLGRSMSHNDRPYNANNQGGYGYNQPNGGQGKADSVSTSPQAASGSSFLRIFLWLMILAGVGAVIWYFVRRSSAKAESAAKRNYSL